MHYDGIFVNPLFDSDPYDQNSFEGTGEKPGILQHQANHPPVDIKFCNNNLEDKMTVGTDAKAPNPMVTISSNFIQNDIGMMSAVEDTVVFDGYLISTGVDQGIQPLLVASSGFQEFLTDNPIGQLEITCNSQSVYKLHSARPTELVLNKNENGWITYIQYSMTFIGSNTGWIDNDWQGPVKNTVDSWNIEPVSELSTWEAMTSTAQRRGAGGAVLSNDFKEYNFPRWKVTHRVAANGIRKSGQTQNVAQANLRKVYWETLESAKKWVSGRLQYNEDTTKNFTVGWGNQSTDTGGNRKFNFTRAVNYDLTTALYEVLDTWISMPSGSLYTEEYTIEASTNDKYVKTVRVNGTIQGMGGYDSGLLNYDKTMDAGKIHMTGLGGYESTIGGPAGKVASTGTDWSSVAFEGSRYNNARRAWHGHIKDVLPFRASSALNASNTTWGSYTAQFDPANYNRFSTVNNPVKSKESLLWPIPIATSETFDPKNGTVSYSYEYNNKLQAITGVISENVTISDTGPTDVFAEVFVLGRRLGPVLQGLGAKTSSKRDVNIEVTVMPPTGMNGYFMTQQPCPMFTGGTIYGLLDTMASGLAPFGARDSSVFPGGNRGAIAQGKTFLTRDEQSWRPAEGIYTRSLSWVFQQCDTSRRWDDI